MPKFASLICALLLPLISAAQETHKKTFFVGRSFYFWLLVVLCFYFAYLYHTSKDKKAFTRSNLTRTISIALGLFVSAFLFVNVFLSDQGHGEPEVTPVAIEYLLGKDEQRKKSAESDMTNIEAQYDYIYHHFQIPATWDIDHTPHTRDDYDMTNLYFNQLFLSDSLYVNIGLFGMGMISYHQGEYDKALEYLHHITIDSIPYVHNYLARSFLAIGDTTAAIHHFEEATLFKNREYPACMRQLVSLYSSIDQEDKLLSLATDSETSSYIPRELARYLFYKYNHQFYYLLDTLSIVADNFKATGFIAAFCVMLVWLVYIVGLDIFERERQWHIAFTLLGGMIFSFLTFYISDFLKFRFDFDKGEGHWDLLMYYVFNVGAVEEFVKIIPLLLILWWSPRIINEPYDYILYAAVSALGFAFIENLLYFSGSLNGIIQGRAMTSVPGHMIDSSIVAYGLVLARYRYQNLSPIVGFSLFFLLGAINHGLYDYFLVIRVLPIFLFLFILSLSIWIIIINNCLNNSPSFTYKTRLRSGNLRVFISLSLISILIIQYVIVAWENGPSVANQSLDASLIIGGILIIYYADRLASMDLVRGYWASIPFRTVYEKQEGEDFDFRHFMIRIIAGDTMPHSFVGKKIRLQASPGNQAFRRYFPDAVTGDIYDRVVVSCISRKSGEAYNDPYWFRLRTSAPIYTGLSKTDQDFIFKFEHTRPSFNKEKSPRVFLYTTRDQASAGEEQEFLRKKDLRPLGVAVISEVV